MKRERPILFSAPMVRAILAGRKTQTRRIARLTDSGRVKAPGRPANWHVDDPDAVSACPYGFPGDRLWVRETWGPSFVQHVPPGRPRTLGGTWGVPAHPEWIACAVYRADGDMPLPHDGTETARWTPSIHMPRWASRITLEVTGVRIERLNEITEGDAIAEGVLLEGCVGLGVRPEDYEAGDAAMLFRTLWDRINGKRAPWASNPWVWVVEFRREP